MQYRPAGEALAELVRDPVAREALESDGFAIVKVFDDDDLAEVRAICDRLHPAPGHGFETDFESADTAKKEAVDAALRPIWARCLPRVFTDPQVIFTSFLLKWPGAGSTLPLHQDWSYVDERSHLSVVVWAPLVDTGPDTPGGPLRALPGSHRLTGAWRGPTLPQWFAPISAEIEAALVPLTVRAGEAAIMDNRVLHASFDNDSDRVRPVAAAAVTAADAPLIHAVARGDEVELLDVTPAFYLHNSPSSLAVGPPEGLTVYDRADLDPVDTASIRTRLPGVTTVAPPPDAEPGDREPADREPAPRSEAPPAVTAPAVPPARESFLARLRRRALGA